MAIIITSKREGFRRCGMEHSETPKMYQDDAFTSEQLKALEAERMLIVQHVEDEPEGVKWDKMNVEQLKAYAAAQGIDLGEVKKRAEILAVIVAAEETQQS